MRLTKEQNKQYFDYILSCIDNEAYEEKELTEPKEKLQFLFDTFTAEKSWEIDKYGKVEAFKSWVQGLPTCFSVAFENYRIVELAENIGNLSKEATETERWKIINNYFDFITNKTFQLFKQYKIV